MFRLGLRGLRYRWVGFAATFIGMFLCTAITTASGGLLETGLRDAAPPDRLAAAPILVAGDTHYELPNNPLATLAERVRVPADLAARIAAVPGVASTVADVSFPARVLRDGRPVADAASAGHAWSSAALTPYTLRSGAAPLAGGQVVLDEAAGVAVGATVPLAVRGGVETFTVTGIAAAGPEVGRSAVFFSPPDVRRFAGEAVDIVGVFPAPGADVDQVRQRIAAALAGTGTVVLTGDERGYAESPETLEVTDLVLIGGLIGGLSLMAGLLGVASTLALVFQQRMREMALLRAIGATPRQVKRLVLAETAALSLLATALAVGPGVLLSMWLYDRIVDTGLAPRGVAFHLGPIPVAVAAAASLLTAVGAAAIAGRRAARVRPIAALADAETPARGVSRVRIIGAIVCFGISGLLVVVTFTLVSGPLVASPANFATIFCGAGLALIGPLVARGMTRLLGPAVQALGGLPGYLATLNLRARVPQVAAVVTPIMLFVAIATANLYSTTTETGVTSRYTQAFGANTVLEAGPEGFAPATVAKVRAINGVRSASAFVTSAGYIERPTDPWQGQDLGGSQLIGIDADGAGVNTAPVVAGSLADLRGSTIALTVAQAEAMAVHLGDTITMRMGDRAVLDLRLVALFGADRSFESILMPAQLLAAHTTAGLPGYLLVDIDPAADQAAVAGALRSVVAEVPGATVAERTALNGAFLHHLGAQALVTLLMIGMLLGYIAIQVINNLVLSTSRRRREFGLQRLTGSTRGQVLRMAATEGAVAGFAGILLGTLVAPLTVIPFSLARAGTPVPTGSPWIYVAVIGFAALVTMIGTLLPTWLGLRARALDSIVAT